MHKEPLCFSSGCAHLVWFKGARIKFRRIDGFANGMLEEVKHKFKQGRQAGMFFNVSCVVFFDGEGLKVGEVVSSQKHRLHIYELLTEPEKWSNTTFQLSK